MKTVMNSQMRLLEVLARNEDRIAELYKTYSSLFEEDREFWAQLSEVELMHGRMIRSLKNVHARGHLIYRMDALKQDQVAIMEERLIQDIRFAKEGRVDRQLALATAVGIESSLLEKGFFESALSLDPEFGRVAETMVRHCENHRLTLEKRMQSVLDED